MPYTDHDISESTKKIFKKFDLNNDSYIDRSEFEALLNEAWRLKDDDRPVNQFEIDAFISKYDKNMDCLFSVD